jgi:hypothetical protein
MVRTRWAVLALVAWLTHANSGWCQMPGDPAAGQRPAAYVLPPAGQVPVIEPKPAPFVDDSPVGPPGWFGEADLFVVWPHLNTHLRGTPNQGTDTVFLTTAGSLDTTVSPTFVLGYRLPEQLGEFSLAYRFEVAEHSGFPTDPLGGTTQRDRLNVNLVDLDWAHDSPFALPEGWGLRFNVGVRVSTIFFDTQRGFNPANAAGQLSERASSNFWGAGPEAGCAVARELFVPGLALVGKVTGAHLFGSIHQSFAETTPGAADAPLFSSAASRYQVAVPMLTLQIGLSYSPPGWSQGHFQLGYQWEEFWQIGRLHDQSNGDLLNRGLFLRAVIDF